jgi:hypothetical protein
MTRIPTFIINLASRPERRSHILREFEGKSEFDITVVNAIQNENGLLGLWQTIKQILRVAIDNEHEAILICQDDHQFTDEYSPSLLIENIEKAKKLGADIILGGVSWFQSCFHSTPELIWIDRFTGLQFAILYKPFFATLLNSELEDFQAGDLRISALTENKWVIYPFISTQKDFGYSDITANNNQENTQQLLFRKSNETINILDKIDSHFREIRIEKPEVDFQDLVIPAFFLGERTDYNIEEDELNILSGNNGFDIKKIQLHNSTPKHRWELLQEFVRLAISREESMVLICNDRHSLTPNYSRQRFLETVIDAYMYGADMLFLGLSGNVSHILPVSDHLYWINSCNSCQLVVVFDKMFKDILDTTFDEMKTFDDNLAQLAVLKMIVYPFYSTDIAFGNMNDYVYREYGTRFERMKRNFDKYSLINLINT